MFQIPWLSLEYKGSEIRPVFQELTAHQHLLLTMSLGEPFSRLAGPHLRVCKEIKPVNPKGNQNWIFIGRTDAEAETPILWPPDARNWLIGKDPDAGKDWRREEKGTTEHEIAGFTDSMDMSLSKLWELVIHREVWRAAVHGVTKSQTWLSD